MRQTLNVAASLAVPEGGGVRPKRDALDKTFDVTLIVKGVYGVVELIGGILLLVITPATIDRIARWFTHHALAEDTDDFVARHLLYLTDNLHKAQIFGAVYLLIHGVVKPVIVIGLLRREHWAYYVAFVFLGGFVVYQIFRLSYDPSVWLTMLTIFDLFIIGLTWREYRRMRAQKVAISHEGARSNNAAR
jgi:uncharacterized membrane protein